MTCVLTFLRTFWISSGFLFDGLWSSQEHDDRGANDNGIANIAHSIRNFSEEKEAEGSGKKDLRVVINRQLAGRSMSVGCRNGELPACGGKARAQ